MHLLGFLGGLNEETHGTKPGPGSDKFQGLCSSFLQGPSLILTTMLSLAEGRRGLVKLIFN